LKAALPDALDRRPALQFSADWLGLREKLDQQARNKALAQALADRLKEQPRLLDLGAGTGSLFRFMAPLIGRPQTWIFADADETLLHAGLKRTAEWAERNGLDVVSRQGPGKPSLSLGTSTGKWRIETLVTDLGQVPHGLPLDRVDAVVCSALLDLTSRAWMARLFAALRVPFYAGMSVNGRDAWVPLHSADRVVRTAFRRDQRRDKGLGPALGNDAGETALRLLSDLGFQTRKAASDWRIPGSARTVTRRLAQMTSSPALQAMPGQKRKIADWTSARLKQAVKGRLSIRIGHFDILGFPPDGQT
jgi:SAM-dependent methyltransferase